MFNQITKWLNRILNKDSQPQQSRFISTPIREAELRERMKGERDFKIKVTEDGQVSAHCKSCDSAMRIKVAEQDNLCWFICQHCKQVSFYPVTNVHRDMHLAKLDGSPLEYELFFMIPPPDMQPPD
jgi:hypothetical protein